jgi:hypothetical protein
LGLLENHLILRLQFAVLLNGRYKNGRRGCNQYMVTCSDDYISLPSIFHAVEIEHTFVNCNAEDYVLLVRYRILAHPKQISLRSDVDLQAVSVNLKMKTFAGKVSGKQLQGLGLELCDAQLIRPNRGLTLRSASILWQHQIQQTRHKPCAVIADDNHS